MLDLLAAVEQAGYGLTNTPAPGDITLGGVLAVGGHGTSVPAVGELPLPGHTYGSVSNLVVSLTVAVWDTTRNAYVLKTFQRNDPDIGAFLVHLGRAFITEATLRLGVNFYTYLSTRLTAYRKAGQYPMNGPWEVRCTGLDNAADCGCRRRGPASVEPGAPAPGPTAWDTAVWVDLLTLPGATGSQRFYREIEQWVLSHYTGSYAAVRAEWSKGWAYSGSAAWADPAMLGAAIPNSLRIGQGGDAGWDTALVILDRYDPGRIYSNTFLETLMP
jgi:FAD/FMN-containing dehydrogenase